MGVWFSACWQWLGELSGWRAFWVGVLLAIVYEAVTLVCRFGLGWEAARKARFLSHLTFGLRIHHGYIGALLLILAFFNHDSSWRSLVWIVGWTLLVSDLLHHFVFCGG